MTRYTFAPRLLARREADPTSDPYRAAGRMLRDHLGGGDIFAEVREQARRDPRLRALLDGIAESIAPTGHAMPPVDRRPARRARRPR